MGEPSGTAREMIRLAAGVNLKVSDELLDVVSRLLRRAA
jgi:hypothetical protein